MVRLILGRAGTGKTARVFDEIARRTADGSGSCVLLVPEQYSHEAERELCRAAGDALSLYGEVLSFTGLARRVFSQCGGARPVMDGGGRLLCMAVAMENVAGRLEVYRRGRRDARLLESLVRAADELKNAGLTAEGLLEAAEGLDGELAGKLRDLALLMEGYAAAQGRSAADPAEVMELLAERIGTSPTARCAFYVDGFSDFTRLEKRVLRELIRAGAELTVCLTCAPEGGAEVFALSLGTARFLRETAAEYGVPCREEWMEPSGASDALRWFRDHLFDFTEETPPAAGQALSLVRAGDIYEECELAAARMAELARHGARWRELAVAVRGFGDYRTALESACARYEVPLFLSGRGDMLRRGVPLVISCALEAVIRGYEYEAVFGYLKTGLSPIPAEECDRLENYAILWDVRGSMWARPFTQHPEGYNRQFDETARERLAALNATREALMPPLLALEAAVKAADTARAQAAALADFLGNIGLAERLEARSDELRRRGRAEAAAEYEQLWDIVCAALEQFADVLGDMPMDGERFRELFCLMLSKYDVGVIPVSLDRVQAGDFDGMRRRHLKHLFVLGATDGRLPAPEEAGGVFTAEERERLSQLGVIPGGAEEELGRELWRIYSCLALPSDSLWMSCPASEADGSETRPSVIWERARALFGPEIRRGDLMLSRTFSREAAFQLAAAGEAGRPEPVCQAARAYFTREGRGEELAALVRGAGAGRGSLGPEAVAALYGKNPSLSATRAEKFASCRFAYFLQYGLKAKPRQRAVFDPRDYGTFMHSILEQVVGAVMALGGFSEVTAAQVERITDECVDRYISEELNDFAEKSARFEYLFRRLRATVRRVTEDVRQELSDSRFRPIDLELDLTAEGVLEPGADEPVRLTGQIDRVDGWVKDDALYLRVTDYKTGVKKFSLSDVCEGINLQMLLYLFALQKRGGTYLGAKELRPAGVLYSPARYDILRLDGEPTDEELDGLRRSSARRSGLVLNDPAVLEAMEPGEEKRFLPVKLTKAGDYTKDTLGHVATLEQFGALSRYIDGTLREMASELRAGSVAADPWFKNMRDNACARCDFVKACMFDETRDCRRLRVELSPDEAWERIGGGA